MSTARNSRRSNASGAIMRRAWIGGTAALGAARLALGGRQPRPAAQGPQRVAADEITVYIGPSCACCHRWLTHLRAAGFHVTLRNVADVTPAKRQHGVPPRLVSCHTGVMEEYAIEAHVPDELMRWLATGRPAIAGLAVRGLPGGSPGMAGGRAARSDVLSFTRGGETTVYAVR